MKGNACRHVLDNAHAYGGKIARVNLAHVILTSSHMSRLSVAGKEVGFFIGANINLYEFC
jgi:hypothetical protein